MRGKFNYPDTFVPHYLPERCQAGGASELHEFKKG